MLRQQSTHRTRRLARLQRSWPRVDFFRRERDEFDGDGAGGSEEDE